MSQRRKTSGSSPYLLQGLESNGQRYALYYYTQSQDYLTVASGQNKLKSTYICRSHLHEPIKETCLKQLNKVGKHELNEEFSQWIELHEDFLTDRDPHKGEPTLAEFEEW